MFSVHVQLYNFRGGNTGGYPGVPPLYKTLAHMYMALHTYCYIAHMYMDSVDMVFVKKNATLMKNDCAHRVLIRNGPHVYGLPLGLCGKLIAVLFVKYAKIFANAPHFHRKSAAIQGLWRFTRRRSFRDSVKVRRTQRDKRGAWYALLISAAVARLFCSTL